MRAGFDCCWLLAFAAPIALTGCGSAGTPASPPKDAAQRAALREQIAAVVRGETTKLVNDSVAFTDDDLVLLNGLGITELLLDNSGSQVGSGWLKTRLPAIEHLRFRGTGVDDAALEQIASNSKLRILNLPRATFGDKGLASLQKLPRLTLLRFGSPNVTDAGIARLGEFPALKQLHLIGVPITEKGLLDLAQIKQLQSLYIDDTDLPDDAWDRFFQASKSVRGDEQPLHVHINQQHHDRDPHKHPH